MSWESNTILYHCNDERRCLKFLNSNTYMILSPEDGKWLGQGMYFWDNLGNAKYWEKEKRRKEPDKKHMIVAARVSLENVLDLTDKDICKELENVWSKYKEVLGIDSEPELGKKLNLLYRSIPDFSNIYKVIKVLGRYVNTPPNGFVKYMPRSETVEPVLSAKVIYNVKRNDAILERISCDEVNKYDEKGKLEFLE